MKAMLASLLTVGALAAQSSFEVASVTRVNQHSGPSGFTASPGSLTGRNVSLKDSIKWAYELQNYNLPATDTLDADRFEIVAKSAAPVAESELRRMLQSLLTERFKLAFHRESKTMNVYALVIGKGGHKLQASSIQGDYIVKRQRQVLSVQGMSVAQYAGLLSDYLEAPVLDATGLDGRFDFKLDRGRYLPQDVPQQDGVSSEQSMFFYAIQQELGLKLEKRKAAVEVVAIDHFEKPTEN